MWSGARRAPRPSGLSGYVDVGAQKLYYARRGAGHPLVLLHGAFGTIESCFAGRAPQWPAVLARAEPAHSVAQVAAAMR
jgi:hypothetical protein